MRHNNENGRPGYSRLGVYNVFLQVVELEFYGPTFFVGEHLIIIVKESNSISGQTLNYTYRITTDHKDDNSTQNFTTTAKFVRLGSKISPWKIGKDSWCHLAKIVINEFLLLRLEKINVKLDSNQTLPDLLNSNDRHLLIESGYYLQYNYFLLFHFMSYNGMTFTCEGQSWTCILGSFSCWENWSITKK